MYILRRKGEYTREMANVTIDQYYSQKAACRVNESVLTNTIDLLLYSQKAACRVNESVLTNTIDLRLVAISYQ